VGHPERVDRFGQAPALYEHLESYEAERIPSKLVPGKTQRLDPASETDDPA
jgi:hypothetical protein